MQIVLTNEMQDIFLLCMETINSFSDPDNPNLIKDHCQQIRKTLQKDPDFVSHDPSYLSLALYQLVHLNNEGRCIFELNDGNLPDWDEIKIHKSGSGLVNKVREIDDDLALKASIVAFCLSRADDVVNENGELIFSAESVNKDSDDIAQDIDQEQDDDTYDEEED